MVHHGTSIPFTDDKRWILWHIWTLLILLYDNPTHVIVLSLAYKELAYLDVILTCLFTLMFASDHSACSGELPGQVSPAHWCPLSADLPTFCWRLPLEFRKRLALRRETMIIPNGMIDPTGPAAQLVRMSWFYMVLPSLCSADIQCWFCEGLKL